VFPILQRVQFFSSDRPARYKSRRDVRFAVTGKLRQYVSSQLLLLLLLLLVTSVLMLHRTIEAVHHHWPGRLCANYSTILPVA